MLEELERLIQYLKSQQVQEFNLTLKFAGANNQDESTKVENSMVQISEFNPKGKPEPEVPLEMMQGDF